MLSMPHTLLVPVIRVAGKDGYQTVQLLGQHDTNELVRPCLRTKADAEVGRRPDGIVVSIRPADRHHDLPKA